MGVAVTVLYFGMYVVIALTSFQKSVTKGHPVGMALLIAIIAAALWPITLLLRLVEREARPAK